ncbi:hypothetical protein CAEBREN_10729 [Caenorhabditis brenneri]|uniref:Myosin motor domain-containing protein n=1 Tax=Caenorhabditis brenneri TaxID=135651 RepID=G0P326_CAEBE|nr:hypothetical protein CAEBREN_10729 [Caenorhabditis brenneri]
MKTKPFERETVVIVICSNLVGTSIADIFLKAKNNEEEVRHLQTKKVEERIEDLNNQIWIEDDTVGYRLVTVIDEGLTDCLVGFRDEQGFFEKKRIEKTKCEVPSLNNYSEDLCTLTQPNAATVLHALNIRYTSNVIHTYCGLFCVVINPWRNIPIYSDEVKQLYQHRNDLPPHVYSVAQNAFHGILKGGRNQSILITGESGAGKTENTKKIIDFILSSSGSHNTIGDCVVTSGVLLEAMGNARTTHNSNSSRFGKFIRIEFDENSKLIGAQIECYLLEKSRVVSQSDGDRNFHIFYQMLSNYFDNPHKSFLKLSKKVDQYKYLRNDDPMIDDAETARLTDEAFTKIGFSEEEKRWIFQILSAVLWIGDIKFGERSGLDVSYVESMQEVDNIAELLEMKNSKLVDALTQPTIKVHDKLIRKNQNLAKTLSSASAMAKVLYERLFGWVVKRCNDAFSVDDNSSSCRNSRFIAVLDIAGFEIIEKNSFEQFCINYTNEKLQQFFNHFMFVKEQSDYLEEGIKWTQVNFANHLQPTIDLIEKPMGVLSFLEEECVVPNGSEKSLLEKLCSNLSGDSSFKKSKQSQKCSTIRHFAVQHYAGEVHYNIDGWLEKNRDNVETSVLDILSQSTHPLLKVLFPPVPANNIKARRGTITNSTVSFLYKNQLQCLLDTLNTSSAHFIRCVVPNYEKLPGKIDAPLVLAQLSSWIVRRLKKSKFKRRWKKWRGRGESVLEKKYNDQHKKVMKMNDILRDYERKIEQLNMEKADLETENSKVRSKISKNKANEKIIENGYVVVEALKEAQNRQDSHYSNLEKELLEKTSQIDDLQNQVQKLLDETNEQRITIAKLETALEDEKSRFTRQNNTIGDMQKLITELNEKIARLDNVALNERNSTRKVEREKEKLNDELNTAKEIIQKQAKKIDELKEECRKRGNEVSRLERKLEDKDAMMADCVKELKDSHKERLKEMEQKVEDVKRKNSKLENENSTQRSQIETFQRESSVDSDYGRSSSGRLSTLGRQYSLTSIGSFSSIRTVGLSRKDSVSDMTSSMYSLRGRRDSTYDMTSSIISSGNGLQRSPSTSQVMEKERRIQELEKEKAAINTDLQLVKRELDVYKSQLSAVESEKESLQTTVRKQTSQLQETTRQFNSAQKNADNLALRLKKALADCDEWKKKHEESIKESKTEILLERKRAMDRAEASEKETELKQSRMATIESAKTALSGELGRTQAELDRCRQIILQLEENLKSQETLGNSFERHQSNLNFEIENLRDENCALKAKIRRQYKQIELLTQQDETNDELNHFENKTERLL